MAQPYQPVRVQGGRGSSPRARQAGTGTLCGRSIMDVAGRECEPTAPHAAIAHDMPAAPIWPSPMHQFCRLSPSLIPEIGGVRGGRRRRGVPNRWPSIRGTSSRATSRAYALGSPRTAHSPAPQENPWPSPPRHLAGGPERHQVKAHGRQGIADGRLHQSSPAPAPLPPGTGSGARYRADNRTARSRPHRRPRSCRGVPCNRASSTTSPAVPARPRGPPPVAGQGLACYDAPCLPQW